MKNTIKRLSYREYQTNAPNTKADLRLEAYEGSHMSLGLFTELGELQTSIYTTLYGNPDDVDITNVKEEIGDTLWYYACLSTIASFNMETLASASITELEIPEFRDLQRTNHLLIVYTSEIADCYKKLLAYREPVSYGKLQSYMIAVLKLINNICRFYSLDINNVMYVNIAKLAARYPNKFRAFNAVQRDLDKERKTLEDN